MDTPWMGMIMAFGFNFSPLGWEFCNGQLLPIAQYSALFSLLGTTYGGDGVNTFALPNLQGRAAIHQGAGPGLSVYSMGEADGIEACTLAGSQLPQHGHQMRANMSPGDTGAPMNAIFAETGATDREYLASGQANVLMSNSAIGITGGNQPHNNLQPYLTVNFCIATEGVFPSRN